MRLNETIKVYLRSGNRVHFTLILLIDSLQRYPTLSKSIKSSLFQPFYKNDNLMCLVHEIHRVTDTPINQDAFGDHYASV